MNKVKKYVKNHKKKCIIISVCLVIMIGFIISAYAIISYLIPNSKKSVYGDRCDVTVNHPIATDREDTIKELIKKYEKFEFLSYEVKCNLVDIIVQVDDSTNFTDVKKMGKELLTTFKEDELKYYDIQLLVKSNNEKSEDYPQIGTHHKEINGSTNEDFVW